MKWLFASLLLIGSALLAAPAVLAEDLAIVIANEFYRNHPQVRDTVAVANLDRAFRNAGFTVVRLNDTQSNFRDSDADALLRRADRAERLVVVISGHIVRANGEGWLLHSDAGQVNALTIGRDAIPIRAFLALAAAKQGDSVVAIAGVGGGLRLGAGVSGDFVPQDIGQGVTVLTGSPRQIGDFIANDLLVPGRSLSQAVLGAPNGLRAYGYIPQTRPFLEGSAPVQDTRGVENVFWQNAQVINTTDAYESYLSRFPNGQYAAEAQRRLDELRLTPQDRAQIAEDNLGLTRDQRRSIQRNLTLLGFDTAGIDGIFGRRSRTAIAQWQASIGVGSTGYLTANQISRLEVAAATRAEQLRREAEERRLDEERRDRQYWSQTGAGGSTEGLHAYLHRYPDGLYSEQAQETLRAIEREQRRLALAAERQAWDVAVMEGTRQSYLRYLNDYPDGRFAEEAKARVVSLTNPETPRDVVEAARDEEDRLNLNPLTWKLIEVGLRGANLDPGQVDGRVTSETRRAIRQYQRANSLDVTGFMTKATIVRLLAQAVN